MTPKSILYPIIQKPARYSKLYYNRACTRRVQHTLSCPRPNYLLQKKEKKREREKNEEQEQQQRRRRRGAPQVRENSNADAAARINKKRVQRERARARTERHSSAQRSAIGELGVCTPLLRNSSVCMYLPIYIDLSLTHSWYACSPAAAALLDARRAHGCCQTYDVDAVAFLSRRERESIVQI